MKQKLALWGLGFLVLFGLVWVSGLAEIRDALEGFSLSILSGLLVLQIVTLGLIAYQWQYVLRRGEITITFREVFAVNLAGGFIESVTPSSKLGGEAAKVYLFRRLSGAEYEEVSSALLVHKYVSLLPFFALCLGIALFATVHANITVPTTTAVALFFVGTTTLLLFWFTVAGGTKPSLGRWIRPQGSLACFPVLLGRRLPGRVRSSFRRGREFLREATTGARTLLTGTERRWLFIVSLLVWGLYPVKIYVVAVMLDLNVSFTVAAAATILAYLVSIAPLSPGGTGTFEGTLAVVFAAVGVPFPEGVTVAVLSRIVTFWFPLVLSAAAAAWLVASDHQLSPEDLGLESLLNSGRR